MQKAINMFAQRAKELEERSIIYVNLPNGIGINAMTYNDELVDYYNRLSDIFYPIDEIAEVLVDNDYDFLDKKLVLLHEKMISILEFLIKANYINEQLLIIHKVGANGNFIPKNLLPKKN